MQPTLQEMEDLIALLGAACQDAHKTLAASECYPLTPGLEKAASAYEEYQLFTGKKGPVGPIRFSGRIKARGEEQTLITEQQGKVLALVMRGEPNKAIARELNIVEGTTKLHIKRLLLVTGCRNRTELALWGYSNYPELKEEDPQEESLEA